MFRRSFRVSPLLLLALTGFFASACSTDEQKDGQKREDVTAHGEKIEEYAGPLRLVTFENLMAVEAGRKVVIRSPGVTVSWTTPDRRSYYNKFHFGDECEIPMNGVAERIGSINGHALMLYHADRVYADLSAPDWETRRSWCPQNTLFIVDSADFVEGNNYYRDSAILKNAIRDLLRGRDSASSEKWKEKK